MIRRLINEVCGQVARCRGIRRFMVIAGNRATSAEREIGRLDRATPQLASDMADQAASTLRADRSRSTVLEIYAFRAARDVWPVAGRTETQ